MTANSTEQMEHRLRRLEDQAAISDVLYKYAEALDYGDEQAFADCFTEHAVWEAHNAVNDSVMTYNGRASLKVFAAGHTRAPELFHKHIMTSPRIRVDGDNATSQYYLLMLLAAPGGLAEIVTFGRYLDKFRREPDGRWRISHRRAEADAWNPMWGALRNKRWVALGMEASTAKPAK